MFSRNTIVCAALAGSIAAIVAPSTANAVSVLKSLGASPANVCTGALPTYEGKIRKRPLAVVNEGTSTAFVTCGSAWFKDESALNFSIEMNFSNGGTTPVSFNCTGVYGSEINGPTLYFPKTVAMDAQGTALEVWFASEGFDTHRPFSVSCALPPNVSIGNMYMSGPFELDR